MPGSITWRIVGPFSGPPGVGFGLRRGALAAASPARRGRPTLPGLIPHPPDSDAARRASVPTLRVRAETAADDVLEPTTQRGRRENQRRWPRARRVGARVDLR